MLYPKRDSKLQTVRSSLVEYYMDLSKGNDNYSLGVDLSVGMPYWVPKAYELCPDWQKEVPELVASQFVNQGCQDYKSLSYMIWAVEYLLVAHSRFIDVTNLPMDKEVIEWIQPFATFVNRLRYDLKGKIKWLFTTNPYKLLKRFKYDPENVPELYTIQQMRTVVPVIRAKVGLYELAKAELERLGKVASEVANELSALLHKELDLTPIAYADINGVTSEELSITKEFRTLFNNLLTKGKNLVDQVATLVKDSTDTVAIAINESRLIPLMRLSLRT